MSPAPTRRPKRLHLSGLESDGWSDIDWSDEPMITVEDMEARMRRPSARLRQLVRAPYYAARKHRDRTLMRRQRASRGWTDTELWNLDRYLCQNLGAMLAIHADEARNHPPELRYDDWLRQIRTASEDLLAYDPNDAERVAAARAALRWAADNLVDLWD